MKTKHLPWAIMILPAIVLALLPGMPARAAQIQGVTVCAVSTEYARLNLSTPTRCPAANVVGSAGLWGDYHTMIPGGAMWLTASNVVNDSGISPFITFDLGAIHTLEAMKVWNFNQGGISGPSAQTNMGVKLANISFSTDNVTFTTNLANYTFNMAPGTFSAFAQTISMGGVTARYVRIDILTNWATANSQVGLSKVRFIDNGVRPTILSASQNYGSNQVTVVFSEPVDPVSATNKANYAIQSGGGPATILSAAMGDFSDRVVLQTTSLTRQDYTLVASGVYDQGQVITIPNNSTASIKPEVVLWLKADAGLETDEFGNVTQWNDQSVYGHNALTNRPVNQYTAPPTLTPGGLNGLPVVTFNGSQLMNIPDDSNFALNGDMTLCIVFNKAATALGDPISKTGGEGVPYTGTPLRGYTNNLPGPFDFQLNASQKPVWVWGNAGGGAPAVLTGTALTYSEYYIVSMVVRGTNSSCYINGSLTASAMLPEAPVDAGNPVMLGVRLDSGNVGDAGAVFNGNMAEVMIIRGTLRPTDLVSINSYLGAKYGIPIVSLGISEQPASVTAQVGKKATFWVNAVGVPPMTYQWKANGVNIAGATSSSYTTPALTMTPYNGQTYTVTVGTPAGSTNSDGAVLTVVADTEGPSVWSAAKSSNLTNVVLAYSEAVSVNATNPASYSLNNGGAVLAARYGNASSNQVVLTTTALDPAASYQLTARNVQDLYGNVISTVSVPVLPDTLALWLKGGSGVVADGAGLVSQWLDQTTNGNNAVQFSGGPLARPTTGGSVNGVPALSFNSANGNYLKAVSSPSLAIAGDLSIYVVANLTDLSAPRELISKTAGNLAASYDYYVWPSRSHIDLYRGNGSTSAAVTGGLPSGGVPHVMSVIMSRTNVSHYLDGNANGTGVLSTSIGDTGMPVLIGSRNDLAQFMHGDMAEILLFGSALSAADRATIDNYLGIKYFPFTIAQQPTDVTTNQGVAVTFSVAASQGSAHLTYQWRVNGLNIPDATNVVYITPILAPTDDGRIFDVVIAIPGFATNLSSAATLRVNNLPPTIVSVGKAVWSPTQIVVFFSEVVDPATATMAGNYLLDNGATVLSAVMGDAPNKVVLTTTPLDPAISYNLTVQNVRDPYNNTIVTASRGLGLYPTGTALWLKADEGVVFDSGSGWVSQWNDQSGNGNHLIAGSSPMLVSGALNGLPVVSFDGVSAYMYANSTPSLAITGDMSIFAVVTFSNLTSSGSSGQIVSKTTFNQPAPFDYYVRSSAVQFYRGNGTSSKLVAGTSVPTAGEPHLLGVIMQATTVTHRLDGKVNGTGTLSTPIADNGDALFIGSRQDNGLHLNGNMAELILVGGAMSSSDAAAIENYLGAKYNLVVGALPRISLARAGAGVSLSWPTPTANFTLESTPDLSGSGWTAVTNTVVSANGTNSVTVSADQVEQFFRLRKE